MGNFSSGQFSELIGGTVSGADLDHYEIQILFGLGWSVNPPTEVEYVEVLLDFVHCHVNPDRCLTSKDHYSVEDISTWSECFSAWSKQILHLFHYQLEVSQKELLFVHIRSSCITSAALLNACQGIIMNKDMSSCYNKMEYLCSVCKDVVTNAIETCSLADEEELNFARVALLYLSTDRSEGFEEEETSPRYQSSDCRKGAVPRSTCRTAPVHEIESASPRSVLSRLSYRSLT